MGSDGMAVLDRLSGTGGDGVIDGFAAMWRNLLEHCDHPSECPTAMMSQHPPGWDSEVQPPHREGECGAEGDEHGLDRPSRSVDDRRGG